MRSPSVEDVQRSAHTPLKRWCACGILLGLLGVAPTVAQEVTESHAQEEHGEEGDHEEHFHRNEVAFLSGLTHEAEGGDNYFTIGFEYERFLTPDVSVGALAESLPEIDAWVFVFPVGVRLYENWFLVGGPGFEGTSRRRRLREELEMELEEGHHFTAEELHEALAVTGRERAFLLRLGTGYKFEFGGRYGVIPEAAFDWVFEEEETARAFVVGVKFVVGF